MLCVVFFLIDYKKAKLKLGFLHFPLLAHMRIYEYIEYMQGSYLLWKSRLSKGLSMDEVAKELGVLQLDYWGWEVGEDRPSLNQISKLSKLLKISFYDLSQEFGYTARQIGVYLYNNPFDRYL